MKGLSDQINDDMDTEMKSDKQMIYAPVIIPTLCRDQHFVRCIESLRRNPWAKYTDVYIGLDYPAKEAHWDGYRKISAYLEQPFPEFHAVHIYRREKNVGASTNSGLLRKAAMQNSDRFIYLEDDLEVSPNFLEYMDKALMEYEKDPDVVMVTGYSYPLEWEAARGSTIVKQNFNGSMWGVGMWHPKRNEVLHYLRHNGLNKDFSRAYRSGSLESMIDFAIKDYVNLCEGGWCGKNAFLNKITDIAMRIYLAVQNKYAIMPLISKVRNHGYDGSGQYCQRIEGNAEGDFCVDNYHFSTQPIDESNTVSLVEDHSFKLETNRIMLNNFDRVSSVEMNDVWRRASIINRRGKFVGAILLGEKAIKKLLHRFKG